MHPFRRSRSRTGPRGSSRPRAPDRGSLQGRPKGWRGRGPIVVRAAEVVTSAAIVIFIVVIFIIVVVARPVLLPVFVLFVFLVIPFLHGIGVPGPVLLDALLERFHDIHRETVDVPEDLEAAEKVIPLEREPRGPGHPQLASAQEVHGPLREVGVAERRRDPTAPRAMPQKAAATGGPDARPLFTRCAKKRR
jgi:hypothetical protein